MIVQLVGFVPPKATADAARHVPPALGGTVETEYAGLPLKVRVNVNNAVSATLLRRTVTVFVLGTPEPRSLKTTGLAGVTVGTVPVALRAIGEGVTVSELVTALIVLVAPTVTDSGNVPVAVGLNVTFIVQEPPRGAPPAQPVSTEKGAAMPFTTTLPASMTELASAVRVNVAVAALAPTSTFPLPIVVAVTVAVWPKAAPLASSSAEAASPDLMTRDLRILNRIVVLPKS
jgi:hypothetical protein